MGSDQWELVLRDLCAEVLEATRRALIRCCPRWEALAAVLPDDPGEVYGDSALGGTRSANAIKAKGGVPAVIGTGTWGGPAALARLRAHNARVRRVRCRIGKVFGTWKRSYSLRRMRWLGVAKAGLQVRLAAMAYNLRRTVSLLRDAPA